MNEKHHQRLTDWVDEALASGAELLEGGQTNQEKNHLSPTILSHIPESSQLSVSEIFGPVLTAIPFKDDADAVAIANDSQYGLAGYLWSQNVERCWAISDQLEAGMIWVNSENSRHLPAPFGGVKASGIGRDGGDWSFDFYMETKNISFALAGHQPPQLAK